jgi:hypothetical protein
MDEQGREILGYIPGMTYWESKDPVPDPAFDEMHLVDAARLLRRYHDIVVGFAPPADAQWRLTAPTKHELICHNDWSPWNALFREDRLAVMLDWDLAGPGSRLWDLANAAYCWAPLIANVKLFGTEDRARRLRLFCDAYGLEDRSQVLPTMRLRIDYVARFIETQARSGDPGFAQLVAWNTPAKMDKDCAYLDEHRAAFDRELV